MARILLSPILIPQPGDGGAGQADAGGGKESVAERFHKRDNFLWREVAHIKPVGVAAEKKCKDESGHGNAEQHAEVS